MGSGQSSRSWGIFEIFVLEVTLQPLRLLFTTRYRKNGGAGRTTCSGAPPIILLLPTPMSVVFNRVILVISKLTANYVTILQVG